MGWYLRFSQSGSTYTALYGARQTLTLDGNTWRVTDPDGTVWEFDAIDELISRRVSPGGEVTEYLKEDGRVVEKRSTLGGDVESRVFAYNSDGNVETATLYRGTTGAPHAEAVRRVVFAYYTALESGKGRPGDLKTVTTQAPDGVSGWDDLGTHYYRYYTADSSTAYAGGLKYVVGPSGYASLGSTPGNATDPQVAAVAEKAYEYDPTSRRVTYAATHGGSQEFSISFTESANAIGYNHWQLKTVATMPDGSTKTVFANHFGQDMLLDHEKSGEGRWIHYSEFSEQNGRVTLRAQPSAIDMSGAPYDEGFADLDVQLNESSGLINVTTYYDVNTPGAGGAPGYAQFQQVKHGSAGSAINQSKLEYGGRTINSGQPTEATVYPVKKRVTYQSDSGGGDPVETTYTHEWWGDSPGEGDPTVQVKKRTEHLPDVGGGQNGGGWLSGNTRVQEYDIDGRLVKSTDARGTVTEHTYDDATGTMASTTQDPSGLDLLTAYEADGMGRPTKTIGPAHDVDGDTVQTLQQTVYLDDQHEVWAAAGYRVGAAAPYDYYTVGPVSITRKDASGRVTDEIQAALFSGGSPVNEVAGQLASGMSFPQTQWCRWTRHEYGDNGRLECTDVYHNIPDSGPGSVGTNYDRTEFNYDAMGRQDYVKTPGGTITRTVYDPRGLVLESWVGTNDTGGGSDNMRKVAVNTYDTDAYGSGSSSLDGLLTKTTQPVDDTPGNDRVVEYVYDWRDRQTTTVTTDGASTFYAVATLDNLGRATTTQQKRSTTLIAQSETSYDDRGRVYQTKRYAVSGAGVAGAALTDNTWYDEEGNVLKSAPAGSDAFTKTSYDAVGRATASYTAYYSGTGTETPQSVATDVVIEQSETTYDDASSVTISESLARYRNGSGNGALAAGTNARPSYTALYYDGIGRSVAAAEYGNQGNDSASFSRPSSTPNAAGSTATLLVSQTVYNARGEAEDQIAPLEAGSPSATTQTTRSTYDDAGRVASVVRNHGGSETEQVDTTYTADGQVKTLTAANSDTGAQVTTYAYGVTLAGSEVASNQLLASVTYPGTGSDRTVSYEYNRQGQRTQMTDQNDSVHDYAYDGLGRQVEDTVSAVGSGVDSGVRRIAHSYDNRLRLQKITSYSTTSGASGVTSDVEYLYNDFSQITTERQQHGAAATGSSPKVQYGYDDASGGSNTIRRESVTYPDGTVLAIGYGSGVNNELSRVEKLTWDSTDVVSYDYLGMNQVVIQKYPEPSTDVEYTLDHGTANAYAGLDRFGRVVDLQWLQGASERVHIKHGYDLAGNRLYRRDEAARANSAGYDQLYGYDGLNRLTSMEQGTLNAGNDAISSATLTQDWTLDQTGNWDNFQQGVVGTLNQDRTHSTVNEITNITESTGTAWPTPGYDNNGNMTSMPQPKSLGASYGATWDAWNRLVSLDDSGVVQANAYDGLGRRITRAEGATTTHFYYSNQWQCLEQRENSSTSASKQLVWGTRYVDDLVLRDTPSERLYSLQDANFNVIAIADNAGAVKERFVYQPYGESAGLDPDFSSYSGADYEWEVRFTGRELDLLTGLQLNRHRYYHAKLGRWVNRDPIAYKGSGWNLYEYNNSTPLDKLDPNGTTPQALRDCKAQCLEDHQGWTVNKSLLNCYRACDENHDKCADMRKKLMLGLFKMCEKKFANGVISQKDRDKCREEAKCIAMGIDKTCRDGGRPNLGPVWRAIPGGGDERNRGVYCYEWAYGYKNACDDCNPEHFDCKVDWAAWQDTGASDIPIHSWCEVRCGDDALFVDDGFMEGFPGYCHEERPCGGRYEWPNGGFGRPPKPGKEGCCPAMP
ncbi:RHS repeat domain-containing protein [Posidoniimonas corsicana]|uniref:RHS repeat domain-containing protein n=1 Tax=Posidoniimonas corsicana TaxID=1938618 RepID=UPI0011B552E2|nr:RHS repeat-associated core domain-containing protein [Posidoniimonas corsicana]